MTDSGELTTATSTYRLLDRDGEVIDVAELPTDGEALVWLEEVRRHRTPRVFIRRIERRDGDEWTYVSPAGDDS
jgi:3-dehydroquinate synthase class II